jgi:hypothetical protein
LVASFGRDGLGSYRLSLELRGVHASRRALLISLNQRDYAKSGSERFAAMLQLSGLQGGSMRQPAKFGPVLGRTSNKELQPKDMLRKRDD